MINKYICIFITVILCFGLTGCVTIVKTGEEATLTGEQEFAPGDNMMAIWDSMLIPTLEEDAVDIIEFLEQSGGDLNALADKYGKYSMGTSGELSYVLKGKATVTEVVSDKKAGYIKLNLDNYTGGEEIKLQIGTVFKGSAVRDSADFIKFEDYKNQVDYAAVSQSLHDIIQRDVIDTVDINSLNGKEIEFLGCFTVSGNNELLITPVALKPM